MATGDNGRPPHPSSYLITDGFSAFLDALDEAQQPEHVRARSVMLNVPFTCFSCERASDTGNPIEIWVDNDALIFLCKPCAHRLGERLKNT